MISVYNMKIALTLIVAWICSAPMISADGGGNIHDGTDCKTYVVEPVVVSADFDDVEIKPFTSEAWVFVKKGSHAEGKEGILTGRTCGLNLEEVLCQIGEWEAQQQCIPIDKVLRTVYPAYDKILIIG